MIKLRGYSGAVCFAAAPLSASMVTTATFGLTPLEELLLKQAEKNKMDKHKME
jgi:hypothetical protein